MNQFADLLAEAKMRYKDRIKLGSTVCQEVKAAPAPPRIIGAGPSPVFTDSSEKEL